MTYHGYVVTSATCKTISMHDSLNLETGIETVTIMQNV